MGPNAQYYQRHRKTARNYTTVTRFENVIFGVMGDNFQHFLLVHMLLQTRELHNRRPWALLFQYSWWVRDHWAHGARVDTNVAIITMTSKWARRRLKSPSSRLFPQPFIQAQIKEMLRVTGLCERNSPVNGEFPTQRASNAENVSIW